MHNAALYGKFEAQRKICPTAALRYTALDSIPRLFLYGQSQILDIFRHFTYV